MGKNLIFSRLRNPADKFGFFRYHTFTEHLGTVFILYNRIICMHNINGEFCLWIHMKIVFSVSRLLEHFERLGLAIYRYEYIYNAITATNCDSKEKKKCTFCLASKIKQLSFWISLFHLLFYSFLGKKRKVGHQLRLRLNK